MYVSDRIVYLQMQKTGCTHITRVLQHYEPGEERVKHAPLDFDPGDRLLVSSVRDPWDWYVSIWAYGCMGQGSLWMNLTDDPGLAKVARVLGAGRVRPAYRTVRRAVQNATGRFDPEAWRRLYADAQDPALFRAWLRRLLSAAGRREITLEGYGTAPVSQVIGFMSYRLYGFLSDPEAWATEGHEAASLDDLRAFLARHRIVDHVIRMERLEQDLSAVLAALGHEADPESLRAFGRTNTSQRRTVSDYYDAETVALVAEADALAIETFGYRAPVITEAASA